MYAADCWTKAMAEAKWTAKRRRRTRRKTNWEIKVYDPIKCRGIRIQFVAPFSFCLFHHFISFAIRRLQRFSLLVRGRHTMAAHWVQRNDAARNTTGDGRSGKSGTRQLNGLTWKTKSIGHLFAVAVLASRASSRKSTQKAHKHETFTHPSCNGAHNQRKKT